MTTDTTSRTAHLLALMKKGDDVYPVPRGTAGISHPRGTRGLLSRLLSGSLAVGAYHATCVTPTHPGRQQAREGAQRDRAP